MTRLHVAAQTPTRPSLLQEEDPVVLTLMSSAWPQNAIFGIRNANIVPRLTTESWGTRATVRLLGPVSLYVWIAKGTRDDDEVYVVEVESDGPPRRDLCATFPTLAEALAYADGEGGGALAATTQGVHRPRRP